MARRVALSASDRRRVSLTSHEAAGGPVERRVLPAAAVASLDNGALRRSHRDPRPAEPGPGLADAPELPPEADRLAVPEADLSGDAAEVWRDVIAAGDGDTLKRGKVRKQIGRTLRGVGLYLFVAAGMHAAGTAKKAKGRAAARRTTVDEAGRGRRSVAAHYPEALPAFDAALRHALVNPAPLPALAAASPNGAAGGGGVIAVDHLLSDGRGSQPVTGDGLQDLRGRRSGLQPAAVCRGVAVLLRHPSRAALAHPRGAAEHPRQDRRRRTGLAGRSPGGARCHLPTLPRRDRGLALLLPALPALRGDPAGPLVRPVRAGGVAGEAGKAGRAVKLAGTGAAMADRAARGGPGALANTTRCDVFESVASRIAAAGELLRESERLARGALALAIEAGGRLASAKAAAKHGEWLPGLAAAGIQPRTAQRAIELHRRAEEARALPGAEALSPSLALRMLPSVAGAGDRRRGPRNPAKDGADTARRRRARPGTPRASLTLTDADKRRLVEAAERRGLSQAALLRAALAAYLGGTGRR